MKKRSVYLYLLAGIVFTFTGCAVLKTVLHHDYKINKYDKTENKEYIVLFHGIYGTEKDTFTFFACSTFTNFLVFICL